MVRGFSMQQMGRGCGSMKGNLVAVFCYLMGSHGEV